MILHNFAYSFGSQTLSQVSTRLDYGASNVSSMTNIAMCDIWNTFAAAGRDSTNSAHLYLGVGSATDNVTYEDTRLHEPITNLTVVSASQVTSSGKILKYVDTTFRNDTNAVIGINEIVFGFNISSNSTRCGYIVARKRLSQTINVNPGETYSISYSLVCKQQ